MYQGVRGWYMYNNPPSYSLHVPTCAMGHLNKRLLFNINVNVYSSHCLAFIKCFKITLVITFLIKKIKLV